MQATGQWYSYIAVSKKVHCGPVGNGTDHTSRHATQPTYLLIYLLTCTGTPYRPIPSHIKPRQQLYKRFDNRTINFIDDSVKGRIDVLSNRTQTTPLIGLYDHSAVLDGQLYANSRRHWSSTSAVCYSAQVDRTALLTERFRSSAFCCCGPVDSEFAA